MTSFRYRPAIDGLRAIAVMAVFIFHLDASWLPGGFVGVDVFFVISGYLITSIILRDCERGEFSFIRFYQRRIARIFPVFFVVALFTMLGASLIYTSQDYASVGDHLVAAALSWANIKAMFEGVYFEFSTDAKPFLHYWSLSVEEQFYLIFPFFYFLVFKYARKKQVMILVAFFLLSFLLCLLMTWWRPLWAHFLMPRAAFYLLHSRGWQLLAGCILAVTTAHDDSVKFVPRNIWFPSIGIGLILLSFIVINEEHHFPGWWALLPTIGTIAVLLPMHSSSGFVEKYLSHRGLVKLGLISYSLYLWHWPIFCLVDYQMHSASEPIRLILKVALSLIASVLSFRFLERPARTFFKKRKARTLAFAFVTVSVALCVMLGVWIRNSHFVDASRYDVANGGLIYDASTNSGTVVLVGDSHGSMYGTMIRDVGAELGRRVVVTSIHASDPLPSVTGDESELWRDILAVVKKEKPEFLVLACNWVFITERGKNRSDRGEKRYDYALRSLAPYVKHIIIFNQPPSLPPISRRSDIRAGVRPPFFEGANYRVRRLKANAYIQHALVDNAVVIDVANRFDTPSGEVPFYDKNGRQLYHDQSHLSADGANLIRPSLIEIITQLSQQEGSPQK